MTGRGMHFWDVLSGNEDVSVVDCLLVKMYQKMKSATEEEGAHFIVRLQCERHRRSKCPTFLCPPQNRIYHLMLRISAWLLASLTKLITSHL
jgi:hypothetical protein